MTFITFICRYILWICKYKMYKTGKQRNFVRSVFADPYICWFQGFYLVSKLWCCQFSPLDKFRSLLFIVFTMPLFFETLLLIAWWCNWHSTTLKTFSIVFSMEKNIYNINIKTTVTMTFMGARDIKK